VAEFADKEFLSDDAFPGELGVFEIQASAPRDSGSGSCGKVENGVVGVHLSYSAPGFQCLLDSEVYLPEAWAQDQERRKKTTSPTT
jgi:hypothetical protein